MRVIGLDLGARWVGVAVSDSAGTVALPHSTLERTGDPERDRDALVELVGELGAERVIVGLPLRLDGRRGAAARAAALEAADLAGVLSGQGVEVETFDERLTTVSAERELAAAGRRGADRRRVVDRSAAAVMLQAWLDGR
ncbi:MAG TPA: Holliday junction resolvase RuvX [Acidimicrobiales bacterium]|nr:Holliday junction resolvase RuvX [Acidimicrobiales bacterium]